MKMGTRVRHTLTVPPKRETPKKYLRKRIEKDYEKPTRIPMENLLEVLRDKPLHKLSEFEARYVLYQLLNAKVIDDE